MREIKLHRNIFHRSYIFYILKKGLYYLIVFFFAFSVIFLVVRLIPGDPISTYVRYIEETYHYKSPGTLEQIQLWKIKFGLDKDIPTQYIAYWKNILFEFDFGPSILQMPKTAQDIVLEALPWTIGLLGTSTVIAWILGVISGTIIGWKRDTKADSILFTISLFFSQIPYYLAAVFLLLTFSYSIALFPSRGAYSPTSIPSFSIEFFLDVLYHATLPALSLVLVSLFEWLISTRALTVSILGEDYLIFAKSKGLKKTKIFFRYILRNTLLPQVTGLAMSLGLMVNGALMVEWIFSYPGLGSVLIYAMKMLDYNVIQAVIFLSISTVLFANFIIELLYPLMDPRIRQGGE